MTTTLHTPGPWKTELWKYPDREKITITGETDAIAQLCNLWRPDEEPPETMGESERDANARLIAAAPDLLAALQLVQNYIKPGAGIVDRVVANAIAKATGKEVQP